MFHPSVLLLLLLWRCFGDVSALAKNSKPPKQSLVAQLQRCHTPRQILEEVGKHLHPGVDPQGTIASLTLVRLSKQLVAENNQNKNCNFIHHDLSHEHIETAVKTLASADWNSSKSLDAAVEGTKAVAVLSRIMTHPPKPNHYFWSPIIEEWYQKADTLENLKPRHLSALAWSMDCFRLLDKDVSLPSSTQHAYDALNLPFRIRPAFFRDNSELSVNEFVKQVNFQADDIRTTSNRVVKERRQTAWEGDNYVAPFCYSGKTMQRRQWSHVVVKARDLLSEKTGQHYNCCLLNLYPDGESGMRYHIDPDQGTLWGYETAVVSVGATRRFAFRKIDKNDATTHIFTLMEGDVAEMFDDCQQTYQHTVKTADAKNEITQRVSLVFKKTLQGPRTINLSSAVDS
ncbi:hypothetical protein ACHAXR_003198 [Thalassiosira sp. AJA248-18]